jgi:hypothetical protein
MSDRVRRIASNESVFRTVNAEIEKLGRGLADISDETLHVVCECGDIACAELIVVPIPDYERIRADDALFFIKPGHHKPDVEDVVEKNSRYHVVRKRVPEAVAIAEQTAPEPP